MLTQLRWTGRLIRVHQFVGDSPAKALSRLAVGITLGVWLLGASACGGNGKIGHTTTGSQVATYMRSHLTEPSGQSLSNVTCPDQRLASGDFVNCRALFVDGSYKDFRVAIGDQDGHLKLSIDVLNTP